MTPWPVLDLTGVPAALYGREDPGNRAPHPFEVWCWACGEFDDLKLVDGGTLACRMHR